ncbi:hypothetical protein EHI8A_079080 [Entamoeba histolytica HM-1:IMSS-B]|uniref:Uncharacterized protein n=6 Tax=Entamoeba histolytica TaxID=5759 RepID=C4LZB4_ENTH1|nr:hypothetical protein EHI_000630 [Entamoeba histolytica HM-1:IMSS]EMD49393.1 Hypothetical protein EHI5A_031220 [Entamoeba histolytica KU27]EMH75827.1 hypothetical protein EHI8A_079080 [Entamoeba histolytica HM-1:IMSS-B]EMS12229.1 hypothetical protein KM1_139320 [Entamoeba histolytica HM-3:IMSS]ENY62114.1 hypothetical protein EHI7A_072030 [Entamoeba histolytica HM-1:IMSS-A]GAT94195.1 hypothetical protein CL6EHI_000630 [Entamoeba histolytica]|eukprot:XP_653194.2 hypothetical protein EHI_000630 [Entamoeba histolytica HM-1:IMSS]
MNNPQLLYSSILQAPPLKSIIHNNHLITITDNHSFISSFINSNGILQQPVIEDIKPVVSSMISTSHGILCHQHSQPIQLLNQLKSKPLASYNPLPNSNCIFTESNKGFYAYHSSSVFKYSFDYFEPKYSKRIKIGTVCSMAQYGWSDYIVCSTYQGDIVLLGGEEMQIIQKVQLKKEINSLQIFNDNFLIIGTRKDDKIYVFDIRNINTVIATLSRFALTNQRIGINIYHSTLFTGNDNGCVYLYDLNTFTFKSSYFLAYSPINDVFYFNNCLITTSGCRYSPIPQLPEDFSDDGLSIKEIPEPYNMITTWKLPSFE